MARWLVVLLFLLTPVSAFGQEEQAEIQKRIEEIQRWSSAVGTWEGKYTIESESEELLRLAGLDSAAGMEVGIKLVLREDGATVSLKFDADSNAPEITGEVFVIPDKIAWHVLMHREGGVWFERYLISFMRVEEDAANFVATRTVHNWYSSGHGEAPTTYYVLGAGQVTRTEAPE